MTASNREEDRPDSPSATLGDVVYAIQPATVVVETEWIELVQAIAAGNQLALHALYERSHHIVFTLIMRITRNRETTEELTVDVFHDVWRRASSYDPANGTVVGWIMNQARSRAIDRVRFDHRQKRTDPHASDPSEPEKTSSVDLIESKQQSDALRTALGVLTQDERHAIEAAFFNGLTHAEVAERLNVPLGTIKTRIRSALHKLRQALPAETGT